MKQTHSANRNSRVVRPGRSAAQQRQLSEMRRALASAAEPVSLVVARFFTAA